MLCNFCVNQRWWESGYENRLGASAGLLCQDRVPDGSMEVAPLSHSHGQAQG